MENDPFNFLKKKLVSFRRYQAVINKTGWEYVKMPEGRCSAISVNIVDVEKRRSPTKHYVYVINVGWSDGKQQVICRRYSHFFTLQTSLIDSYPEESGVNNPADRILPFLPGKILFGRSNVREVALKRKQLINEYLNKLIELPEKLSKCEVVLDFLEATEEDVKSLIDSSGSEKKVKKVKTADNISDPVLLEQFVVIANFKKTDRSQVSLAAGDTVEVIEKNENGWWFVSLEDEQGWAPSSYLEPIDGCSNQSAETTTGQEEKFICTRIFQASLPDEISVELGDVVTVIEKCQDGWWKIRLRNVQGYVPVAHLKKVPKTAEAGFLKATQPSPRTKHFVPPPRKNTVKRKMKKPSPVWESESEETKRRKPPPPPPTSTVEEEVIYVALSDFTSNKGDININEGAQITVLEKSPNGWWFVRVDDEEGWVPSTVAQRQRRPKSVKKHMVSNKPGVDTRVEEQKYVTIGGYNATDETGISFVPGQLAEIVDKDACGWWFVRINNEEGWAPSTFLEKIKSPESIKKKIIQPKLSNDIQDISETIPINVSKNTPSPRKPIKPVVSPKIPRKPETDSGRSKLGGKPATPGKSNIAMELEAKLKAGKTPPKPSERKISTGNAETRPPIAQRRPPLLAPTGDRRSKSPPLRPQTKPISSNKKPERPPPPTPVKREESPAEEVYFAMGDYIDDDEGMLTLKKGEKVYIIEKDEGGWWLAKSGEKTGWVPSNFLSKK